MDKNLLHSTLLFVIKNDEILLAEKKQGFGKGYLNGVGGKVEKGETIEQAMIRETEEEVCITPTQYVKMGEITFDEVVHGKRILLIMHIYIATEYIGEPAESFEMKPEWHKLNNIPYSRMFQDEIIWLPKVLSGNKVKGFVKMDDNLNLLEHKINVVQSL